MTRDLLLGMLVPTVRGPSDTNAAQNLDQPERELLKWVRNVCVIELEKSAKKSSHAELFKGTDLWTFTDVMQLEANAARYGEQPV
jgi:hypothetical protein